MNKILLSLLLVFSFAAPGQAQRPKQRAPKKPVIVSAKASDEITTTSASPTAVPGLTTSFTLAKPAAVLIQGDINFFKLGVVNQFPSVAISIDGAIDTVPTETLISNGGGVVPFVSAVQLPAGSHTVSLVWSSPGGGDLFATQRRMYVLVFQ